VPVQQKERYFHPAQKACSIDENAAKRILSATDKKPMFHTYLLRSSITLI